jgi:invasion protein IalB
VPPDPQRTTASFGDWILRCEQPGPGVKLCEAAQIINNQQGQTVAQIAIGRPVRGEPMRLTILVPPSVALVSEMRLLGKDADKPVVSPEIVWRRCLPGGCMADSVLRDDAIAKLRAVTDPYRLGYQDGAGRDTTLPFSTKGLPQVLDALAREEPR